MKAEFILHGKPAEGLDKETESKSCARDTDVPLWSRFQSGDMTAFEAIYSQYQERLFAYGLSLVGNAEWVKDIIQDMFLELWNRKEHLSSVQNIQGYLFTVTRRKILKRAQKEGLLLSLVDIQEDERLIFPSPEKRLIQQEGTRLLSEKVQSAINKLNKRQQEIIHLKFYADMSYKEIAAITQTSYKQVYYHLGVAIKKLETLLQSKKG